MFSIQYIFAWYPRGKHNIQYIPRNMHTVFALLCFVVVIHWLIFPYPSGLLHWHCGNLTIAPVPAKQPWWIWINTSCEFIMNDCVTTTKQGTTKLCAYFLGYTVWHIFLRVSNQTLWLMGRRDLVVASQLNSQLTIFHLIACHIWNLETSFRKHLIRVRMTPMVSYCTIMVQYATDLDIMKSRKILNFNASHAVY